MLVAANMTGHAAQRVLITGTKPGAPLATRLDRRRLHRRNGHDSGPTPPSTPVRSSAPVSRRSAKRRLTAAVKRTLLDRGEDRRTLAKATGSFGLGGAMTGWVQACY